MHFLHVCTLVTGVLKSGLTQLALVGFDAQVTVDVTLQTG